MENKYKNMGYQNLRIYAKKMGVKNPSSMTKAELVKEIEKIESGKVAPHYTNRGRPRINEFKEKDRVDKLNEIEIENIELKERINELKEINERIEKEFIDFKNIIKKFLMNYKKSLLFF